MLNGLSKTCRSFAADVAKPDWKGKAKAEMLDANTLMSRIGGGNDQVNLMELVGYLKESKLARKVSGFAEKLADVAAQKGGPVSLKSTSSRGRSVCIDMQRQRRPGIAPPNTPRYQLSTSSNRFFSPWWMPRLTVESCCP